MERKLASIKKINNIQPIEGADMIELAVVDGWKVVVAKNVGHKIGEKGREYPCAEYTYDPEGWEI